MPTGQPKMVGSCWRGLTECGPQEGNGKPLQYSCLENTMNSMKRQNDRILKEELLRSLGAQYATGDQRRNNSRKNEGMEPKQKQYGWMASLTRWTWIWVNSGSWWWTGRPGALRFMGSQRVGHDWATELNWRVNLPSWLEKTLWEWT